MNRCRQARPTLLALILFVALAPMAAHADAAAMNACAAKLSPDAKMIFDKTLPQVGPNSDLRTLLTSSARSLVMSGTIKRGDARQSATAAGECLKLRS